MSFQFSFSIHVYLIFIYTFHDEAIFIWSGCGNLDMKDYVVLTAIANKIFSQHKPL